MDSPTKSTTSQQRAEESSSSNKRARTSPAQLTQFVVCFKRLRPDDSFTYTLEFFSIHDLLDHKITTPTRAIPWPDNYKENNNNNVDVRFLHSSSQNDPSDDARLGVLYAVADMSFADLVRLYELPNPLPNEFTCISFSGGYKMQDVYKSRMNAGKVFPLIAEIDHRIYVLSGPTNFFGPTNGVANNTFEEYNPHQKSWKILSDLPLIINPDYSPNFLINACTYSHLVLGKKLFVSDSAVSSVYDIATNTWSACHLFSDCPIPPYLDTWSACHLFSDCPIPPYLDDDELLDPEPLPCDCGPGFPFIGEALLWKGQFLLCMKRDELDPMAVYRIEKVGVEEKARPLKLMYEKVDLMELFPYGRARQLVHIGDDHFALINNNPENYVDMMNIFTFKLEIDATNQDCLLVKDLNKPYSKRNYIKVGLKLRVIVFSGQDSQDNLQSWETSSSKVLLKSSDKNPVGTSGVLDR